MQDFQNFKFMKFGRLRFYLFAALRLRNWSPPSPHPTWPCPLGSEEPKSEVFPSRTLWLVSLVPNIYFLRWYFHNIGLFGKEIRINNLPLCQNFWTSKKFCRPCLHVRTFFHVCQQTIFLSHPLESYPPIWFHISTELERYRLQSRSPYEIVRTLHNTTHKLYLLEPHWWRFLSE